jgi:hypothetical protein
MKYEKTRPNVLKATAIPVAMPRSEEGNHALARRAGADMATEDRVGVRGESCVYSRAVECFECDSLGGTWAAESVYNVGRMQQGDR